VHGIAGGADTLPFATSANEELVAPIARMRTVVIDNPHPIALAELSRMLRRRVVGRRLAAVVHSPAKA
jgi:hypothetical protein